MDPAHQSSDPAALRFEAAIVAEYTALRIEIVKRMELNHQVISLAIIALGTLLAAGIQAKNAAVILIYPIVTVFLAGVWAYNERRSERIRAYILDRIEARVGQENMGWEHALAAARIARTRHAFGWMGGFIGIELVAIIAGLSVAHVNLVAVITHITLNGGQGTGWPDTIAILLGVDVVTVVATAVLLRPRHAIRISPLPSTAPLTLTAPVGAALPQHEDAMRHE